MATFRPLLLLAMTDHGLRATAHVGPINLLLATTDKTPIPTISHTYIYIYCPIATLPQISKLFLLVVNLILVVFSLLLF